MYSLYAYDTVYIDVEIQTLDQIAEHLTKGWIIRLFLDHYFQTKTTTAKERLITETKGVISCTVKPELTTTSE